MFLKTVILHITPGLITGGAERALVRLIQASDKNRFQHYVVSLTDRGTQAAELENIGIAVYELRISGIFSAITGIRQLRKITKSIHPDVIHGWMYHGGLFALLAGSKAPKIMGVRHSLHDLKNDKRKTRAIIYLLARLNKRFKAVVFNSVSSKKQHEAIGYSTKNSLHIPNGFDTETYAPSENAKRNALKSNLSMPSDGFVFGFIARYHPVKNHMGLLSAFAEVVKTCPKCLLVLVGQGMTPDNRAINQTMQQPQLKNNVILMGEKTNIPELLQLMDVYVSPSFAEAFPNTIGEAMACGIPCIATDVGDSAAIIGDTGIVVPSNDNEALAQAMLKMANMPREERETLGKKARQRILDNFRLEVVTKHYDDLYSGLVNV